MKDIIKEIVSYKFHGFYESPFLNSNEFIDMESEDKDELEEILTTIIKDKEELKEIINKLEVVYEYDNIKEYMQDIAKSFIYYYVELIKDKLPYYIQDMNLFKFELVEVDPVIDSPKYYNYRSDDLYFKIDTNIETLTLIKYYTLNKKGAKEYIKNRFTSRDGYISFLNNNIEYWKQLNIKDYEENYLSCLFEILLYLDDKENIFNICYSVLDDVCKYEYVHPIVYYKGDSYDYYNFIEIMRGKYDKHNKYL